MMFEQELNDQSFARQIIARIESLTDGQVLTKEELAAMFGATHPSTVEGWMRRYPEVKNYRIYVTVPGSRCRIRQAVFANLNYKKYLMEKYNATETY